MDAGDCFSMELKKSLASVLVDFDKKQSCIFICKARYDAYSNMRMRRWDFALKLVRITQKIASNTLHLSFLVLMLDKDNHLGKYSNYKAQRKSEVIMSSYYIGNFIKDTRNRKGYTQEQLCLGICTPASLSRIENGAQMPGKNTLDGLLQRLGIEDRMFAVFESKEEMQICEMLDELTRNIAHREYGKLEEHTRKLQELIGEGQGLQQQYLVFAKAILAEKQGASDEAVMELLMQAIGMTLPEFDGVTPLEMNLLTFNEITIINNIAVMHAKKERFEQALTLGFWLKYYIADKVIDGSEKRTKYPMILYNLSNWLGKTGKHKEALQEAEEGVSFCIEHGCLHALPVLIFNKGCALAELGQKDEAKRFFRQAAVFFDVTKQESRVKKTAELCKEHYQIEIES